jgi:hypothetical protein
MGQNYNLKNIKARSRSYHSRTHHRITPPPLFFSSFLFLFVFLLLSSSSRTNTVRQRESRRDWGRRETKRGDKRLRERPRVRDWARERERELGVGWSIDRSRSQRCRTGEDPTVRRHRFRVGFVDHRRWTQETREISAETRRTRQTREWNLWPAEPEWKSGSPSAFSAVTVCFPATSRDYSGDISGSFLKRNPYNFSKISF